MPQLRTLAEHSGDLGYLVPDGCLLSVDRLKDFIISGGENVYSQEVANAIAARPAVNEFRVQLLAIKGEQNAGR